jgi:hypothetical protein
MLLGAFGEKCQNNLAPAEKKMILKKISNTCPYGRYGTILALAIALDPSHTH